MISSARASASRGAKDERICRRSGQATVEFSIVGLMLCLVTLAVFEMGRMVLVYTAVANAARAGARYAMVHGSSRATGPGLSDASGPADNPPQVLTVVRNFAGAGALRTTRLIVNVSYPAGTNDPGDTIQVTVVYPYDPLTTYLPLRVNLGSTTQGVILF